MSLTRCTVESVGRVVVVVASTVKEAQWSSQVEQSMSVLVPNIPTHTPSPTLFAGWPDMMMNKMRWDFVFESRYVMHGT